MTQLTDRSPLYAQVAQEILNRIHRGDYTLGALLPTEHELCEAFGVSRVTIRGAMKELELRGIISRQPGVGTRVERTTPRDRFIHESSSVEDVLQFTQEMRFRQTSATLVSVNEETALAIGARASAKFLRIEGLRVVGGGETICHSTHFVPARFAAHATDFDGQKGSLAALLASRAGIEIDELDQSLEAINLDKDEAALLGVREDEAALATWRRYRGEGDVLLIATRSLFPKDRYSYSLRNRRERPAIERRAQRFAGRRG